MDTAANYLATHGGTEGIAAVPCLDNPTYDSIKVFRAVAAAMTCPGAIHRVEARPPAPPQMSPACAALCLALLDRDTPLWLQDQLPAVTDFLRFHCGCPFTTVSEEASFAILSDTAALPPPGGFNAGTLACPDDSATLLIQVASLSNTAGARLSGPGMDGVRYLDVAGIGAGWWHELQASRRRYAPGVDLIFMCGEHIAALPRSTSIAL